MSSDENFVSRVVRAFEKTIKETKEVPDLEGMERQFRHFLAQFLFGHVLGWKGHYSIGEILDITCFDEEDFPIIVIETKWRVELTSEIKEKLRRRVEELGSVKYGVFASDREFVVYAYEDHKLRDVTQVNVAEAIGVAKGKFGLSEVGKKRILRLELLKRERLVWVEEPDYFEKTYREISLAKREGVKLLTENLKGIIRDLTTVSIEFFNAYHKRKDHYSGRFLEKTFNDWLKLSIKDEEFKNGDETSRKNIVEIFCRETAYVLIGRLLFTRMCEDKGIMRNMISGKGIVESLEYYGKRRTENVYLHLFNESREEIKKYYSHLHQLGFFDWWVIERIQKGTLSYDYRKIQDSLEKDLDYCVRIAFRRLNRFNFAEVNRDILGDVYQGYLPPDERKRLGEFYTPKEVIEYILDAVGYEPENEIRGKKILDPACGSGSFLVEATQRLVEGYRRVGFDPRNPDEAKQIIEGCITSIYGLDIHPFACFIAEMNLLFQLVDLYDTIRREDRYYKFARLNVYCTDSLAPSGERVIKLMEFTDNSRRRMLIEETKGANKVKGKKFDFVVGNPPYIRKERLSPDYRKSILKPNYPQVYHGDDDICVYFITQGIDWLNDGGKFGYIVSGKFMKTRYGKYIRAHIPLKTKILEILDFRGSKVFKEATNDPIILILEKNIVSENIFPYCRLIEDMQGETHEERMGNMIDTVREHLGEEYKNQYIWLYNINQKQLLENMAEEILSTSKRYAVEQWLLLPSKDYEIYSKIEQSSGTLLRKICDVYFGIKKEAKEHVIEKEDVIEKKLESDFLKPVLEGRDVERYEINYADKYLVFPYVESEKGFSLIDEKTFGKKALNLYKYLKKYRTKLQNLYDIRTANLPWYALRSCSYYSVFKKEKIITPDISERNNFAYDKDGYYCLHTLYIIVPKQKWKAYTKFLLGILNSSVIEFFFKHIAAYLGRRGYRYQKQYLERIPIKIPKDQMGKSLLEDISQKVDRILDFKEESNIASRRLNGFPDSYFREGWSFDKLINMAKASSLSNSAYKIKKEKLRGSYLSDLYGREAFRVVIDEEEYLDFFSKDVASFVLENLKRKRRVTKRELLELRIPTQDDLKTLTQQYERDKERIVKNEKSVKELEKQIDDSVYKLYDITYKERRIIEEYLAKF